MGGTSSATTARPLTLAWGRERYGRGRLEIDVDVLNVSGPELADPVKLLYIEVYLRRATVLSNRYGQFMSFTTELVSADKDGRQIELRSTLEDGVVIDHVLRAGDGEVDLRLSAHNPTAEHSALQYATPCLPVSEFTGTSRELGSEEFLEKSFIVTQGGPRRLSELPEPVVAEDQPFPDLDLRFQLWLPEHANLEEIYPDGAHRAHVSPIVPSTGIVGCVSADESLVAATVWEPYQVLQQAILGCIHSCPRIGGLAPGETKTARGRFYLVPDTAELLRRHARDFPEQTAQIRAG